MVIKIENNWSKVIPFMDHSLVVAKGVVLLSEAMSRAGRATQDGQVIEKSSDKAWSTGGGNSKPLQYSHCKNPRNSMKRQKTPSPMVAKNLTSFFDVFVYLVG